MSWNGYELIDAGKTLQVTFRLSPGAVRVPNAMENSGNVANWNGRALS
jgi:hypothetical protein